MKDQKVIPLCIKRKSELLRNQTYQDGSVMPVDLGIRIILIVVENVEDEDFQEENDFKS